MNIWIAMRLCVCAPPHTAHNRHVIFILCLPNIWNGAHPLYREALLSVWQGVGRA